MRPALVFSGPPQSRWLKHKDRAAQHYKKRAVYKERRRRAIAVKCWCGPKRGSIAAVRLASHVQSTDFLWPSHVVPEREALISTFFFTRDSSFAFLRPFETMVFDCAYRVGMDRR